MGTANLREAVVFHRAFASLPAAGIRSRYYENSIGDARVPTLRGKHFVDKSRIKPIPSRILGTPQAVALLWRLRQEHGALVIHQSGGCSVPLCLKEDEFRVGSRDVQLGVIEETPFYVSARQYEYLRNADFLLDVVHGDGESFSLEAATGARFLARSVKRRQ